MNLDREALAKFGLQFEQDHYIPLKRGGEQESILDSILASVKTAANLMIGQKQSAQWEWDVKNLHRAVVIPGGLDENAVERILREEEL